MIKQADKGGAFVVWRMDLYIAEANRHLEDQRFYEKIPSDATQSSQQQVQSFIETAIESNQLPPSATNLIVEHPRTSKFYLLPKIHKPGNPGNPIVSACSCPTELLAVYLDQLTAPFVRNLDSYVKDTTHMLNILDSFRLWRTALNFHYGYQVAVYGYTKWRRSPRTAILSWQERDPWTTYTYSPAYGRTGIDT